MSSEIIYGIDMDNSTTNYTPIKRLCRTGGQLCELATEFGYCKLTACIKRNYNLQTKFCCKDGRLNDDRSD